MGEGLGYKDWDKVVKLKEDSLKSIEATRRNLECGEMVEKAALAVAKRERRKYPEPAKEEPEEGDTEEMPGVI